MALRSPRVRVLAITTVAGNVAVQQSTRNALCTAELCGADVPVFMGAEKPLHRPHQSADWFHGRDGLGDHGYPAIAAMEPVRDRKSTRLNSSHRTISYAVF